VLHAPRAPSWHRRSAGHTPEVTLIRVCHFALFTVLSAMLRVNSMLFSVVSTLLSVISTNHTYPTYIHLYSSTSHVSYTYLHICIYFTYSHIVYAVWYYLYAVSRITQVPMYHSVCRAPRRSSLRLPNALGPLSTG
jgi:hypothetical protein